MKIHKVLTTIFFYEFSYFEIVVSPKIFGLITLNHNKTQVQTTNFLPLIS